MTIKVLHYGLSYNKGGIENVVNSWFNNKPNDIEFDFLNDEGRPLAYEDYYKKCGSKIFYITHRYTNPIKHYKEIKKIIKEGNYDYLHFHVMTLAEAEPVIICNKSKHCKAILHCHSMYGNNFPFKEKLLQLITKWMLAGKKYQRFACSKAAGLNMFKTNDFVVIENGIDTNKFKFDSNEREQIRVKFNVDDNTKIIGHVGHICPEKNYPFMFQTFSDYLKISHDTKLMLIGNMCNDNSIIELAKRFYILNNLILVGELSDTSKYYSAMDMFYLPSINEGLPLVMIEAQCSGLPCLVSNAVSKEVVATENVTFFDLEDNNVINKIDDCLNKKIDRENVKINSVYDIKNSSRKVFDYYRNNK